MWLHRADQEMSDQFPSWTVQSLGSRPEGKILGRSPIYLTFTSQPACKPAAGRLLQIPQWSDPAIYKFQSTPKPIHPLQLYQLSETHIVPTQSGLRGKEPDP